MSGTIKWDAVLSKINGYVDNTKKQVASDWRTASRQANEDIQCPSSSTAAECFANWDRAYDAVTDERNDAQLEASGYAEKIDAFLAKINEAGEGMAPSTCAGLSASSDAALFEKCAADVHDSLRDRVAANNSLDAWVSAFKTGECARDATACRAIWQKTLDEKDQALVAAQGTSSEQIAALEKLWQDGMSYSDASISCVGDPAACKASWLEHLSKKKTQLEAKALEDIKSFASAVGCQVSTYGEKDAISCKNTLLDGMQEKTKTEILNEFATRFDCSAEVRDAKGDAPKALEACAIKVQNIFAQFSA